MKKYLILSLILSFSSVAEAQTSNSFNADNLHFLADIYRDSWALIIGINNYKHMPKLNYAVNDAISIKEMLMSSYDYKESNIKLILDDEATKDNILEGFHELLQSAKEKDRVLIFYAGHGETMPMPSGGDMGYLLPVDGDPEKLFVTSLPMNRLYDIAQLSYAKHILYLVDACYGGLALSATRGLKKSVPNYLSKITREKGRQIITAGGKDEQVLERSEWGHSAFTKNLLTGLGKQSADIDGDGVITADELGGFLAERVFTETGGYHTPQTGRIGTEQGEFIFFNSNEFGDDTSFKEYKEKQLARKREYSTAKTLSWVYPGLGHMKIDQKLKGRTLITLETISLAMTFIFLNNMSTTNDALTVSKQAVDNWWIEDFPGGEEGLAFREAKYLSDHDAHKSASMQFYGSAISSLAVWVYNIYDIKKKQYNYTDNKKSSIFDISFRPDNQVVLRIKL